MELAQVRELKTNPDHGQPYRVTSSSFKWGQLIVNHKIAIPVTDYASYFPCNSDIPILQEGSDDEIGNLCFTRSKGEVTWNDLTPNQFIAFVTEVDYANRLDTFRFEKDYLVISEGDYNEYMTNYAQSAPLWGGFSHDFPSVTIPDAVTRTISEIRIRQNIELPNEHFLQSSLRALKQPYAFESYLKLYHVLELQFDYNVINQIKELRIPEDANKIGTILNDYSTNELVRLTDLLVSRCRNIDSIRRSLERVFAFGDVAKEMFIKFGKSKDHKRLAGEEDFDKVFTLQSFRQADLNTMNIKGRNPHDEFILFVAAYWIYRVRCSIAHHKIGEYLLSWDDERFIVEFADPLVREVVIQCLTNHE